MQEHFSFFSAFLVGFLGFTHCAGMCGGIVSALSLGHTREKPVEKFVILFVYNIGRLTSYTIAGALMGGVGWFSTNWLDIHLAQGILQLIAAVFMFMLGLYLAGWWFGLTKIEQTGQLLWKYIEPAGRKLLPVKSYHHAFILGSIWGWLPCGLVYTALIWTISSGSAIDGGLMMLSFGLGTLPNLLLMGMAAQKLQTLVQSNVFRKMSGLLIISFATYLLVLAVKAIRHVN